MLNGIYYYLGEIEIMYDYKENHEVVLLKELDEKIEGILFGSLCDFLSIDFKNLANKLSEYIRHNKKLNRSKIVDILKSYSPLLVAQENIEGMGFIYNKASQNQENNITEEVLYQFSELIYIQTYINAIHDNVLLRDKEVFRSFVSNFTLNRDLVKLEEAYESNFLLSINKLSIDEKDNQKIISEFIQSLKLNGSTQSFFAFNNSINAICTCIYYLLDRGYTLKRCSNCGKYFVPFNRSDAIYCDRRSPQDSSRTCREYGAEKLWYDKIKQNEAASLCRKILQSKQKKASRYKDIPSYSEQYERFRSESKKWKSDVKKGLKTESEFLEWLNLERKMISD